MQSTTTTTRGPTGAGALMTALAVVVGILTVVRIDVLALPFAFLATGLVVSGVYLVLNLRGLTCAIELPTEIRVGEAMAFDLRLDVSWPLLVPQDVQVRVAFDGRSARPLAVVARFERGTSLALRGSHRFGLRGPREVANVTLVSSAPFRWFELTRTFVLPVRLLVLPAFDRLRNADAMRLGAYDAARRKRKPRAEEHLAAVRPWRPGESERLIHWKLTAKRGSARRARIRSECAGGDAPRTADARRRSPRPNALGVRARGAPCREPGRALPCPRPSGAFHDRRRTRVDARRCASPSRHAGNPTGVGDAGAALR
jgi:hypothetical protein